MTPNVGAIDSAIRIAVGVALILGVFTVTAPWRWVGLIGLVPLLTGTIGWCPLYGMLGVTTTRH
ncbi:DUF2892 domain-containing protein [Solimonas sp. C16B3]|uniref:DUF2892 domain-containing protein n=1 Tax=Solimonas marina TaxID=2714601 RepID=A0A969W8Y9_9GAMM|nr:DUF2892 domain-containing protein [Solimonas marina]